MVNKLYMCVIEHTRCNVKRLIASVYNHMILRDEILLYVQLNVDHVLIDRILLKYLICFLSVYLSVIVATNFFKLDIVYMVTIS